MRRRTHSLKSKVVVTTLNTSNFQVNGRFENVRVVIRVQNKIAKVLLNKLNHGFKTFSLAPLIIPFSIHLGTSTNYLKGLWFALV